VIGSRTRRFTLALSAVALAAAAASAVPVGAAAAGAESTYVIVYASGASVSGAAATVGAAGGTIVASYDAIGVVVARSTNDGFSAAVRQNPQVEGVSATGAFASKVEDVQADDTASTALLAPWGDALSGLQWDMTQINVPQAHAVNAGSSSVVVADLDTGLDFTHPDLAPNYDASRSTDCSGGTPQPLLVGNDKNGHGTHTAGTIAAAANGIGIVGVAPGVKIAGVKTSNDDGFFFPEMVICAYMWVATHGISVTNNSYFADPWLYNCKNDPGQRAIWNAERRAIKYAQQQGVLVVASEGNDQTDLSHPEIDATSPDDTTPVIREVTNACAVVPVEVPGVIGVTATGYSRLKASYSSYGISTADVAAPGGDSRLQPTPAPLNPRVLSTYPTAVPCSRVVFDPGTGAKYCYLQGTSMAGPHVVGIAALILSAHGIMPPGALAAALQQATTALPCPDITLYAPFPQVGGAPQDCQGGIGHNGFYGAGEVDALKAVS
jgi:subtilisin family serine protease